VEGDAVEEFFEKIAPGSLLQSGFSFTHRLGWVGGKSRLKWNLTFLGFTADEEGDNMVSPSICCIKG